MTSETTFDLDINNYTISDLASFLKLSPNYDDNELKEREKTMTMSILSLQADTTYKYDIIEFIKKAVLVCSGNFRASEMSKNTDNYNPNIRELRAPNSPVESNGSFSATGKIVNPYASRPALQTHSIPIHSSNGYNYNTFVTNYVFNTRFRDNFFNSSSTHCSFILSKTLKNVISISLSGLQFPNTFFTFSKSRYTTQIYIQEDDTGNKGIVVLPEGNYTLSEFPGVLQNCINHQILGGVARFSVSIDPYSRFVTISNSEHTFIMKLITPYKNNVGVDCLATNFKVDGKDVKEKVMPSSLYNTLGYQIGFRNLMYKGKKSYTSESTYNDKCMDYFYFSLNDFTNNQVTSTYGVLPQSLLDKNILAVVPLITPAFEFSFDNNSNEIYKTRNYVGPVDISKISIQLLDYVGTVLDIHQNEITFCLQVTCIYDNTIPYVDRSVSII